MNLTNMRRRVAFAIENDVWSHAEVLVDERVSWNKKTTEIDTIFNQVSISVVDTLPRLWQCSFLSQYPVLPHNTQ